MHRPHDALGDLAAKIALLWTGLGLGVAFLATPAKFLAPSITLPIALDVGRQTFWVVDRVELALCGLLTVLAAFAVRRSRWAIAFAVPTAIVLIQALWLIPVLDARVGLVIAGQTPPPSPLHLVYIAAEAAKALWLASVGFSAWPWRLRQARALHLGGAGGQVVPLHR